MNSKRFLRKTFLSILLVTAILLGSFSSCLTVYAVEASGDVLAELGAADTGLTVEKLVLSEDDVPEVIDFAEAQEKGHVLRLRSKESDDNTVVFLNDDNTETMYLFAEPVKYTDEHGNIKDKSTALSLESDAYTMAQNDVKVRFARDISKGVTVNKGGVNITMTPVSTTVNSGKLNADSNAELVSVNENKITYSNVFQSAELVYTTLYSGFKEDIVLESYDGINEFAFIVNTNGLYPVKQENGAVYFFEPNTDELVAKMMQVVCYDSAYNFAEGDVRITEVKANQIYGFTVVADSAFLTDEDTVYPVYVDPTITLDTESTIEDAVVYSGKPTRNYGDHRYSTIGYLDSSYGVGRLMVRFPTLSTDTTFAAINDPDTIISAKYYIFTASGGSSSAAIRPYGYNRSSWTESTVTWNNITVGSTLIMMDAVTVPSGGAAKTEIDVTNAVQAWVDDSVMGTPEQGILFMNTSPNDATLARDFLNVEYALSSDSRLGYMPKLVINYGTTTNTVSIVFVDDDDIDNGKIDIEKGTSRNFTVNLIHNSRSIRATGLLTFESLNTTVVRVPNVNASTVVGVAAGSAGIRARYTGVPTAVANIPVNVWEEEYDIQVESILDFDVSDGFNAICDINPVCIVRGENKGGANFTFSKNLDMSYCVNIESIALDESTGTLTLKPNISFMTEMPAGYISIDVKYLNYATKTIKVNIVNDNFDNSDIEICDFTAIRINYPQYEDHKTHHTPGTNCYQCLIDMPSSNFKYWAEYECNSLNVNFDFNQIYPDDSDDNTILELIGKSKVSVILTHGNTGSFVINGNNTSVTVSTSDILDLPQGYFSQCELIICLFCSGGSSTDEHGTPNDMSVVEAFVEKGAQHVVGFVGAESFANIETFTNELVESLATTDTAMSGKVPSTYSVACENALEVAYQGSATQVEGDIETLDGGTANYMFYRIDGNIQLLLMGRGDLDDTLFPAS